MSGLFFLLIPVGLLATAAFLGLGIYSLARGGAFSKKNANNLMRLRVVAQAVTIAILMVFTLLISQGSAAF